MAEKANEEPNKSSCDLNESNEGGEILTLSDILNEQREIDEVPEKYSIFFQIISHQFNRNEMWFEWFEN